MKKPYNEVLLEKKIKTAVKKADDLERRLTAQEKILNRLYIQLDRLQEKNAKAARKNAVSYGVKFVRRKALNEIKAPGGWEESPGKVRVSDRRFACKDEAAHHGKRFTKIEGHKSFSVFKSRDEVNAWVNWKTGKTNPLIGLKRTCR